MDPSNRGHGSGAWILSRLSRPTDFKGLTWVITAYRRRRDSSRARLTRCDGALSGPGSITMKVCYHSCSRAGLSLIILPTAGPGIGGSSATYVQVNQATGMCEGRSAQRADPTIALLTPV